WSLRVHVVLDAEFRSELPVIPELNLVLRTLAVRTHIEARHQRDNILLATDVYCIIIKNLGCFGNRKTLRNINRDKLDAIDFTGILIRVDKTLVGGNDSLFIPWPRAIGN